jgi:hypothetical protein
MTYMSVKEKVDPEAHADNHLAMVSFDLWKLMLQFLVLSTQVAWQI